jgi:hypothetical protein
MVDGSPCKPASPACEIAGFLGYACFDVELYRTYRLSVVDTFGPNGWV